MFIFSCCCYNYILNSARYWKLHTDYKHLSRSQVMERFMSDKLLELSQPKWGPSLHEAFWGRGTSVFLWEEEYNDVYITWFLHQTFCQDVPNVHDKTQGNIAIKDKPIKMVFIYLCSSYKNFSLCSKIQQHRNKNSSDQIRNISLKRYTAISSILISETNIFLITFLWIFNLPVSFSQS